MMGFKCAKFNRSSTKTQYITFMMVMDIYMSYALWKVTPEWLNFESIWDKSRVVKSKLEYYNRSFTITGAKLWNSLPQNIKDMPTLSSFKHSCKTYLLSLQQF